MSDIACDNVAGLSQTGHQLSVRVLTTRRSSGVQLLSLEDENRTQCRLSLDE
jgi:hypothetical protein